MISDIEKCPFSSKNLQLIIVTFSIIIFLVRSKNITEKSSSKLMCDSINKPISGTFLGVRGASYHMWKKNPQSHFWFWWHHTTIKSSSRSETSLVALFKWILLWSDDVMIQRYIGINKIVLDNPGALSFVNK